jgi:hypothetical protein
MLSIRRYLVLVAALVGMGLGTVWWKSRTLAMGYEAVELGREIERATEEERMEDALLSGLVSPPGVSSRLRELSPGARSGRSYSMAAGSRRGGRDGRRLAITGRRVRPGGRNAGRSGR